MERARQEFKGILLDAAKNLCGTIMINRNKKKTYDGARMMGTGKNEKGEMEEISGR